VDFLLLEEETYFKAKNIALASVLKIELADGSHKEGAHSLKTATDAILSPYLEPSV
jgi:hypothetical protein